MLKFSTISDNPGRQWLQRLVWDAPEGAEALFFTRQINPDGRLRLSTNAYFNLFFIKRWHQLTGLTKFALTIKPVSPGRLHVFGVRSGTVLGKLTDQLLKTEIYSYPLSCEVDFYFFDWLPEHPEAPWPLAEYTAERGPGSTDKLKVALISTTFERNEDIYNTVNLYELARARWHEIEHLTHFYVINNQIKDAEKLAGLTSSKVTLINNPHNTGGAGGFGLGARRAVAVGDYSHVLFMDDDIIIHPESWLRSLSLLSNLAPQYQSQVISGSMFLREAPTFCQVIQEALNQSAEQKCLSGREDLADPSRAHRMLLAAEPDLGWPGSERLPLQAPLKPYAAWWYCLMPIKIFYDFGYPLPIFFRGDDQELGLRIRRKVLSLNGICVWHPNLQAKRNPLRIYLGLRNKFIIKTLHCRNWRKKIVVSWTKRLTRCLAVNDYAEAAVTVMALADFRKFYQKQGDGPDIINRLNRQLAQFKNIATDEQAGNSLPSSPKRQHWIQTIIVAASLGGALLPERLFFAVSATAEELNQVKGKVSRLRTVTAKNLGYRFQRRKACRLALIGLGQLGLFLFFSPKLVEKLTSLIEFPPAT